MSLASDAPLDMERFSAWIGAVLMEQGQDLLRTQGILHFGGKDLRFAYQAVHMIADGDYIGPWRAGDLRQSRIVFIGRSLNRPQIRRGFEACMVAQYEPDRGVVKIFRPDRGFGFITCDSPMHGDVSVHITALEAAGIDEVRPGDRLEFAREKALEGRFRAAKVRLLQPA